MFMDAPCFCGLMIEGYIPGVRGLVSALQILRVVRPQHGDIIVVTGKCCCDRERVV